MAKNLNNETLRVVTYPGNYQVLSSVIPTKIDEAAYANNLDFIKHEHENGSFENPSSYTHHALNMASAAGNDDMVEFFLRTFDHSQLKYSSLAIDFAAANNHCEIIKLWFESGLKIKFSKDAVNLASANGHVDVLELLKSFSGKNFLYGKQAIDLASEAGYTNILDWWLSSGFDLKFSSHTPNGESRMWWIDNLAELENKGYAIIFDA